MGDPSSSPISVSATAISEDHVDDAGSAHSSSMETESVGGLELDPVQLARAQTRAAARKLDYQRMHHAASMFTAEFAAAEQAHATANQRPSSTIQSANIDNLLVAQFTELGERFPHDCEASIPAPSKTGALRLPDHLPYTATTYACLPLSLHDKSKLACNDEPDRDCTLVRGVLPTRRRTTMCGCFCSALTGAPASPMIRGSSTHITYRLAAINTTTGKEYLAGGEGPSFLDGMSQTIFDAFVACDGQTGEPLPHDTEMATWTNHKNTSWSVTFRFLLPSVAGSVRGEWQIGVRVVPNNTGDASEELVLSEFERLALNLTTPPFRSIVRAQKLNGWASLVGTRIREDPVENNDVHKVARRRRQKRNATGDEVVDATRYETEDAMPQREKDLLIRRASLTTARRMEYVYGQLYLQALARANTMEWLTSEMRSQLNTPLSTTPLLTGGGLLDVTHLSNSLALACVGGNFPHVEASLGRGSGRSWSEGCSAELLPHIIPRKVISLVVELRLESGLPLEAQIALQQWMDGQGGVQFEVEVLCGAYGEHIGSEGREDGEEGEAVEDVEDYEDLDDDDGAPPVSLKPSKQQNYDGAKYLITPTFSVENTFVASESLLFALHTFPRHDVQFAVRSASPKALIDRPLCGDHPCIRIRPTDPSIRARFPKLTWMSDPFTSHRETPPHYVATTALGDAKC